MVEHATKGDVEVLAGMLGVGPNWDSVVRAIYDLRQAASAYTAGAISEHNQPAPTYTQVERERQGRIDAESDYTAALEDIRKLREQLNLANEMLCAKGGRWVNSSEFGIHRVAHEQACRTNWRVIDSLGYIWVADDAKAGALRGWGWTEYVPPFSPPIQGNNDGVVRDADGTTICDTHGHEGNAALIAFALNELARTAPAFESTGQEGDKGL